MSRRVTPPPPLLTLLFALLLVSGSLFVGYEIWTLSHPAEESVDPAQQVLFDEANEVYARAKKAADFASAIRKYERLARDVRHEELYYNLGNAYFSAGDIGQSVYWYERAVSLDPGWAEANENLRRVRDYAQKSVSEDWLATGSREPWYVRAVSSYTLDDMTWVFMLLYVALFSLLIALRWIAPGVVRSAFLVVTATVGLATLVTGAGLADKIYIVEKMRFGIVLPRDLALRVGPLDDATSNVTVHAGQKVRILSRIGAGATGEWLKIRLSSGYDAYVKRDEVGILD